MQVTLDYVRSALALQGIPVHEDEIDNIHRRLTIWFDALETIEAHMGKEMDLAEPIPPIDADRY
ncbi:hypothetical protein [Sodalis sp. dw_96]|uniref:hypothetical protein n=1 Tax=Sodalis sp. dw_96 TaxID=2719794 RepID=UPI001BD437B9|nr:hypothetical protein [Sodalis sp. dw_96]